MPNQSQKPVDIGGQAVLEGVMMKGPEAIAITVRRPDKTMVVDYKKSEPLSKKHKWMGLPVIRGAVNMVNMLVMGMTTLETSAKMLGTEEEEPTKFEKWLAAKLGMKRVPREFKLKYGAHTRTLRKVEDCAPATAG